MTNNSLALKSFRPNPPDAAGVLSWAHLGDLHMVTASEQNDLDLGAIVTELNATFAQSLSFAFLPGDIADHGDVEGYTVVQQALRQLALPWCAIVGDHDVQQRSFRNFLDHMAQQTHYAFTVGDVHFVALNAFDVPEPTSFAVLPKQLQWAEAELRAVTERGQRKVILMHCYPSDLKQGGEALTRLLRQYRVALVDMGHTHYNEISNDGHTLYTATRSTGQVEEGAVGFSITNIDGDALSWRFLEIGRLPAVIITSPADERLMLDDAQTAAESATTLRMRAKVWCNTAVTQVQASLGGRTSPLQRLPGSNVWEAALPCEGLSSGIYALRVTVTDAQGMSENDEIQAVIGSGRPSRDRVDRDQRNALGAWPEHGLLGTQLGPNKNGRKW